MWAIRIGAKILGVVTSKTIDPAGVMGGVTAEYFKNTKYAEFNWTNESLGDRETNLFLIQLASDYQSGSIGGNVTKALGDCFIRKEDKIRVLARFTIDWAGGKVSDYVLNNVLGKFLTNLRQVFRDNYKIDNIGVNIVYHYVFLTKDVEADSSSKALASEVVDIAQTFIPGLSSSDVSNEVDVIINTLKIHQRFIQQNYLPKALVEAERKVIWQINEENVTLLIANNESNWNKHREANDLVNNCLRLLRMRSGSGSNGGGSQPEVGIYLPYLRGLKSFIERKDVDKKQDMIYVMNKQIESEELSERVTSHQYQYQVEQRSYGFY